MEEVEMFYNLVGGGKTMDGPKRGLSIPLETNQRLPYTILPYHFTLHDNTYLLTIQLHNANGLKNLH